jgi:hypothetical protein
LNYAILVKAIIVSSVLFSERIGAINIASHPINYIAVIPLPMPKPVPNPNKDIPLNKPFRYKPIRAFPGSKPIPGASSKQSITLRKIKLFSVLKGIPEATSYTLSSKKLPPGSLGTEPLDLKAEIKDVLANRLSEDRQTLLVAKAARNQIRDINNLTLAKCEDAIQKIEASKGIKLSKDDRLLIAAGILLLGEAISQWMEDESYRQRGVGK